MRAEVAKSRCRTNVLPLGRLLLTIFIGMVTRICENGHVVDRPDQFYCPVCRSVDIRVEGDAGDGDSSPPGSPTATPRTSAVSSPRPASLRPMANEPGVATSRGPNRNWKIEAAEAKLRQLLTWGIVGGVAAGIVLGLGLSEDTYAAVWLGILLAWVANGLVFVALIGFGVKYGREAADV